MPDPKNFKSQPKTSSANDSGSQPPECPLCEELRQLGAEIGERVSIHPDAKFDSPHGLVIEDDVQIGPDVRIDATAGVSIGARTIVSPGVLILSTNPIMPSGKTRISENLRRNRPVHIREDAWIGPGAILLPTSYVGAGAVVEAGLTLKYPVQTYRIARAPAPRSHQNRIYA